ncbi:hypothetical protein Hanom_Chr12g01142981 [Helianthus anomalus]
MRRNPHRVAVRKNLGVLLSPLWCRRRQGLGVPGGGAAAGGTAAGSILAGEKRKPEQTAAGAGEMKRRKIKTKRSTEPQQEDFSSLFDAPSSPPHDKAEDAGVNKDLFRVLPWKQWKIQPHGRKVTGRSLPSDF